MLCWQPFGHGSVGAVIVPEHHFFIKPAPIEYNVNIKLPEAQPELTPPARRSCPERVAFSLIPTATQGSLGPLQLLPAVGGARPRSDASSTRPCGEGEGKRSGQGDPTRGKQDPTRSAGRTAQRED